MGSHVSVCKNRNSAAGSYGRSGQNLLSFIGALPVGAILFKFKVGPVSAAMTFLNISLQSYSAAKLALGYIILYHGKLFGLMIISLSKNLSVFISLSFLHINWRSYCLRESNYGLARVGLRYYFLASAPQTTHQSSLSENSNCSDYLSGYGYKLY